MTANQFFGSSCGTKDPKPSSCGSACGSKDPKAYSACGSACGSKDPKPSCGTQDK
jgi:hypothetical protein